LAFGVIDIARTKFGYFIVEYLREIEAQFTVFWCLKQGRATEELEELLQSRSRKQLYAVAEMCLMNLIAKIR
jgi:hypothetical protein